MEAGRNHAFQLLPKPRGLPRLQHADLATPHFASHNRHPLSQCAVFAITMAFGPPPAAWPGGPDPESGEPAGPPASRRAQGRQEGPGRPTRCFTQKTTHAGRVHALTIVESSWLGCCGVAKSDTQHQLPDSTFHPSGLHPEGYPAADLGSRCRMALELISLSSSLIPSCFTHHKHDLKI